jgi:hypothetical protein
MKDPVTPELAAALLAAQGVKTTPQGAEAGARFVALVLGNAAPAFAQVAFEAEPASYTAILRKGAP